MSKKVKYKKIVHELLEKLDLRCKTEWSTLQFVKDTKDKFNDGDVKAQTSRWCSYHDAKEMLEKLIVEHTIRKEDEV